MMLRTDPCNTRLTKLAKDTAFPYGSICETSGSSKTRSHLDQGSDLWLSQNSCSRVFFKTLWWTTNQTPALQPKTCNNQRILVSEYICRFQIAKKIRAVLSNFFKSWRCGTHLCIAIRPDGPTGPRNEWSWPRHEWQYWYRPLGPVLALKFFTRINSDGNFWYKGRCCFKGF